MTTALDEELLRVGDLITSTSGELGANLQKEDLIAKATNWIKNQICPKKHEILKRSNSREADIAVVISEIILFGLGNAIPGVPLLSKAIAEIGLEKFCNDTSLLTTRNAKKTEDDKK